MLHWQPFSAARGKLLEFHAFDDEYLERLRAGDARTQEHFFSYFSALIQVKLRSRQESRERIEDIRQETFARFHVALQQRKIQRAECLGSYVNSMCNNVWREKQREEKHYSPLDEDYQNEIPALPIDMLAGLTSEETKKKVREILDQLPERNRRLLRAIFFEERDKDDVCREFGVSRDFLRVLLHRAKKSFKDVYLKDKGGGGPMGHA